MTHLGIDFGARLSGKTVVASVVGDALRLDRVPAGEDADAFLERTVQALRPDAIYLDAPLSLPAVYRTAAAWPAGDAGDAGADADWFLREADRALGAMSPLFLGGLTARAMRLAARWRAAGIPVHETWPRGVVRTLGLADYRAQGPDAAARFTAALDLPLPAPAVADWHEADAVLAWWAGWRHRRGAASVFGREAEGLILC